MFLGGGINKRTLTFTILLTLEPAAVTMALMLSQHAWVLSPMLPSIRFPEASAGIWPETKTWPLARMAWDYVGYWLVYLELDLDLYVDCREEGCEWYLWV
jgi:hypothetical protein